MEGQYKILDSRWWGGQNIGIVAVESFVDEWKAYIGCGTGVDQEWDNLQVAAWGASLMPEEAHPFFPHLDIAKYKRDDVSRTIESE